MTALGWWTMLVICGFVWGGFFAFLASAIRAERRKSGTRNETPS